MSTSYHEFPASRAQRRLWFLDGRLSRPETYNSCAAFRIIGAMSEETLRTALDLLVRRHDALRAGFLERHGDIVQRVHDDLPVRLDVSVLADPGSVARKVTAAATVPFDLSSAPLFRAYLFRVAADERVLLLVFHHAIVDNTSLSTLTAELEVLYGAVLHGEKPPLAPLRHRLSDLVSWQDELTRSARVQRQAAYWEKVVTGLPDPAAPPPDRPRQNVGNGAIVTRSLGADPWQRLRVLCRDRGTSAFTGLYAALSALLARYSGEEDVVIAAPFANNPEPDRPGVIGYFLNTAILRLNAGRQSSFIEVLDAASDVLADTQDNVNLPYDEVIRIAAENDRAGGDLFRVMLSTETAFKLSLEGCVVEPLSVHNGTAKFDLTVFVFLQEDTEDLRIDIEFNTDRYDTVRAEQFLEHFCRLTDEVTRQPTAPLSSVRLLGDEERRRVLARCAGPVSRRSAGQTVHDLVSAAVTRFPNEPAVTFGEKTLTYRELEERADRLAGQLHAREIGEGKRVGISLQRSLDMPVAVLGVLKTGAAYVPLDPTYPAERLRLMAEQADLAAVLVDESSSMPTVLPTVPHIRVRDLDGAQKAFAGCTNPDSPAYITFTSGSAGRPKGAILPHRVLVNLLEWHRQSCGGDRGWRTLQFTSLSFDVSFQEIFATWIVGGTVVLVDDEVRRDPDALVEYLRQQHIHRLFLPFVALEGIAQAAGRAVVAPTQLRQVITAGEQLQVTEAIRAMFRRIGPCELRNHYGPTETHLVSELVLVGDPDSWPTLPSIGRPIVNTRLYVVNAGELVPDGVPGELVIGGAPVGDGYLGQPDLTARSFGVDRFTTEGRTYRTGDLVRRATNGDLEFLGRADDQVKIRGYRVEPAEVENTVRTVARVSDVCVVAREDTPGIRTLAAFVVPAPDTEIIPTQVVKALSARLPDFMVPARVIALDSLPMTPSGKVDRRTLADRPLMSTAAYEPAAEGDETERRMLSIWAEVLASPGIGVTDSFFQLGGHSLLAVRLVSRIRDEFEVSVGLRELFKDPTVRGMTRHVRDADPIPPDDRVSAPVRRSVSTFRASLNQELTYLALEDLWLVRADFVHIALRLEGRIDIEALRRAFARMTERQEVLRYAFLPQPEQLLVSIAETAAWEVSYIEQLAGDTPEERLGAAISQMETEIHRPLDRRSPPLARAALYRVAPDDHVLFVAVDHAICDGWSLDILVQELSGLYTHEVGLTPSPPPLPKLRFSEWASQQRDAMSPDRRSALARFWRAHLGEGPADLIVPLPVYQRRTRRGSEPGKVVATIDDGVRKSLNDRARAESTTLFALLAAVLLHTLGPETGNDVVTLMTTAANRGMAGADSMIGWCCNDIWLRTELSGATDLAEILRRFQERLIDGLQHADGPTRLTRDLVWPGSADTVYTEPSIYIVLNPEWGADLSFPGVRAQPIHIDERSWSPGLQFFFTDRPDGLHLQVTFEANTTDETRVNHLVSRYVQHLTETGESNDGAA